MRNQKDCEYLKTSDERETRLGRFEKKEIKNAR